MIHMYLAGEEQAALAQRLLFELTPTGTGKHGRDRLRRRGARRRAEVVMPPQQPPVRRRHRGHRGGGALASASVTDIHLNGLAWPPLLLLQRS